MERYRYLKCNERIAEETFGCYRELNQIFYKSNEWKRFRRDIIIRDYGLDMGLEGHEIFGPITIHHIEPITIQDILNRNPAIVDPDNAVCVSDNTHKAIHFGNEDFFSSLPQERKPNDTCPWR